MSDEMIPETEFSTIPFLGFFVGPIDTKVVGAARRGARPGRRVSHAKPNVQAFGLHVQFCGLSPLIVKKYLSPFFPIGCLIIRRENDENQGSKERFL